VTADIMNCPATMCPLFAKDGSPWTGAKDAPCPSKGLAEGSHGECGGCPWWDMGCSDGGPHSQIDEVADGGHPMVAGPSQPKRTRAAPREYDCPKASECQWQARSEATGKPLCPPRWALSLGLDPRNAAF